MTARPFEATVDVETPELVMLTYSLAGIGSRVLAALTDLLICVGAFVAVIVLLIMLPEGRPRASESMSTAWAFAILGILQFVVIWGYYVLFEGLMDGQTPGKRLHRLRVVRDGGYSVTFGVSAVRNLVRMIDMQPGFFYLVGLVSVLVTKRGRRLGDLVAGTLVVREELRAREAPVSPRSARAAVATNEAVPLNTALTEEQFAVLSRFVERWATLDPLRRTALAAQLAEHFAAALPQDRKSPGQRLLELHERERAARTRGAAARGETGAGRERQAIIAAGMPRWTAFAARLAKAQKQGLASLGETEVRDFVSEYRALSGDLARLRTASSGRAMDELFFLGRLVAGAHNLLYRDRGMGVRGAVRYLFTDVPREVRRSWRPIAFAALLLFGPAFITGIAVVRTPKVAQALLPPSMLDRAEKGVARARDGDGYIDDPQILRPVMASNIITNNVQVTFAVFAGGISAGLLSMLLLVTNGISIGSVMGLYISKGIGTLLLAFVAPHGVLELFAICVAGGGAFLVAAGLLMPGARTRRDAIVENARRAIRLIAASTLLLVVAGSLEGLVSPIPWWPIEGKLAVSGVTLVLLVVYLRGGRSRAQETVVAENLGDAAAHLSPLSARRSTGFLAP